MIEPLELRIAPASVLSFTDVDGDKVKITSSLGDITGKAAIFDGQLRVLNLTDASFQGTDITTTVTKAPAGDGLVHIGFINATGRDLGKITIKGDLGQIDCGDTATTAPALALLSVRSMGRFGTATQGGTGNLISSIEGTVGAIKVSGDVSEVSIFVLGKTMAAEGRIGGLNIGGSLLGGVGSGSGEIFTTGDIASVKIGGDVIGGRGGLSGIITSAGQLGSVTIGGSLIGGIGGRSGELSGSSIGAIKIGRDVRGGDAQESGWIFAFDAAGTIASVRIGGSLLGGDGAESGAIFGYGGIGPVKIGGDVRGGSGDVSGRIDSAGALTSLTIGGALLGGSGDQDRFAANPLGQIVIHDGQVFAAGDLGPVKVGRDVSGASGIATGQLRAIGKLGAVSVGGSLIGASGTGSGQISSGDDMGAVKIGGDLRGGSITGTDPSLDGSGYLFGLRIRSVSIGGSVISGTDASTGGALTKNASIRALFNIGPISVKGSLIGNTTPNGNSPVILSAFSQQPFGPIINLAIASLSVGGRVERALILAGYEPDLDASDTEHTALSPDAQIGPVKVGRDWIASSIVAGVNDTNGDGFGNSDDVLISFGVPGVFSRIASITIKGLVIGTAATGDHFGFCAEQIGSFKSLGYTAPLNSGTSAPIKLSPTTADATYPQGDVTILEV